jgi:hypothetical protein
MASGRQDNPLAAPPGRRTLRFTCRRVATQGRSPAECGSVAGQARVRRREATRGQVGPDAPRASGPPQRG